MSKYDEVQEMNTLSGGKGDRVIFWEEIGCGEDDLRKQFLSLYKVFDAKEALVKACWKLDGVQF